MVEEVLNLALGEGPLIWPGLVLLDVLGVASMKMVYEPDLNELAGVS